MDKKIRNFRVTVSLGTYSQCDYFSISLEKSKEYLAVFT